MDRCALFVDAGYLLADGAMAVHGTRHREAVSWDFGGLLQLLGNLARERTSLPMLRCYWYEATVEGRRAPEHEALADLPGLKLRLGRIRPGRREGVDTEIHRDLMTLARNGALADAVLVSGDEDLAQVVADAQDLGVRVTVVHVAVDGNWTISRVLRQECDDLIEIGSSHLRPYVNLLTGVEGAGTSSTSGASATAPGPLANGSGHGGGHSGNGHGGIGSGTLSPLQSSTHTSPPPSSPITGQPTSASHSGSGGMGGGSGMGGGNGMGSGSGDLGSGSSGIGSGPSGIGSGSSGLGSGSSSSLGSGGAIGSSGLGPSIPGLGSSAPGLGSSASGLGSSSSSSSSGTGANPLHALGLGTSSGTSGPSSPSGPLHAAPTPGSSTAKSPSQSSQPPSTGHYSSPPPPMSPPTSMPSQPHGPYTGPQQISPLPVPAQNTPSLSDAVKAAHQEGQDFGESVARDAPALWLEAVLARKPRMPSDLEARLLQGSSLPIDFLLHDEVRHALRRGFWIDFLLHDEVRHALRRGFWDALERSRR
ncbi:NYN domain-containing protein [Actinomadura logoneensis]|uniref:NYN domain-containing protein n=1 Tax=Actinomadura logoneensis TaxID=2293572 RepID=A0A372JMD6_9ACTN|nr:NYN domain-containing protein [Actinomadura logoneensis]RFU41175.1 NYN domain-containing protein [Actinomadura logoneensis]